MTTHEDEAGHDSWDLHMYEYITINTRKRDRLLRISVQDRMWFLSVRKIALAPGRGEELAVLGGKNMKNGRENWDKCERKREKDIYRKKNFR